jgi:hypothetical protein
MDLFKSYYGKNYDKVVKATPIEIKKMKDEFRKKYPNATMSVKIQFWGHFCKRWNIYFISDEFTSYDITSDTFRDNPEWDKFLHWTDGWRSVMSDAISSKSQHHFNR